MARTLIGCGDLPKQQQLIISLLDPKRYPHPAKTVRLIETHISWVLLAGRYAYKIKKALDLGFLDASTLESRRRFCVEELRLNRRLAPQLYLDVVPIGGSPSHPEWNMQPAIEYAVKMRRFASEKTWDKLIVKGKIEARHIDSLALTLAHFHLHLPSALTDSTAEFTASMHASLMQNFAQLSELLNGAAGSSVGRASARQNTVGLKPDLHPNELTALQQASEHAFDKLKPRIAQRCVQGFVRECHGDLHLGNIALIENKPTPFDGIDFNAALRRIDVMDEVAFLFMDLLHHQRADLAYRFLNAYLEVTGDYAGIDLLDFYCAYRATVRAKVCAIRASQASIAQRLRRSATNSSYLSLARQCLAPQQPSLIITHGLPGSGKSSFAQAALERMSAIRLRSDVERKRLFGLSALESSHTEQKLYSAEATQRTYAHLLSTARTLLAAGYTVIVDAAFLNRDERKLFRALADEARAPFAIATLQTDDATLRARIRQRQALANDASEADMEVLDKLQAAQEPLSSDELRYTAVFFNEHNIPLGDSAWNALQDTLSRTE